MQRPLIIALLATVMAVSACDSANEKSFKDAAGMEQQEPGEQPPAMDEQQEPVTPTAVADSGTAPNVPQQSSIDWDKKIIRTASLSLEVKNLTKYYEGLRTRLQRYGAYTSNEENIFSTDRSAMDVTIKVPVQHFAALMNELPGKEDVLIERSVKAEDVTAQVADVKSRLQTKQQVRERYLALLKQAGNMNDVLQVQKEISSIQEEIEAATARLQFLSTQSAFSTIQLHFYEPLAGFRPGNEEPGFGTKLLEALGNGAAMLKSLLLGLVTIWPLLLLVTFAIIFWRRKTQRKIVQAA